MAPTIGEPAMTRKCLVVLLCVVGLAFVAQTGTASAGEDETGFKNIFNGRDLAGWDGDERFWSVREGLLTGQTTAQNPTKGNTFLIWRLGQIDDFELRLGYRHVGGKRGLQYPRQ